MMKSDSHLFHASYIHPLIHRMERYHLPEDYLFRRNNIRFFDLENPDTFIPLPVLYEYLTSLNRELGLKSLAATFLTDFRLDELGDYGEFLAQCPDLLAVLINGIKYEYAFQTNSRMNLEINGPRARFYHYHLDDESEAKDISLDMSFAMIINAFKMILGPDWRPLSMTLTPRSSEALLGLLPNTSFQVHFSSNIQGIAFDTNCLVQKNPLANNGALAPDAELSSNGSRMEAILRGLDVGFMPTLTQVADFLKVSERTVERNLAADSTSFSQLLQQNLFRRALKWIQNPNMTINEISDSLGYANAANFIRAFKGWTQMTPRKYRELMLSHTVDHVAI